MGLATTLAMYQMMKNKSTHRWRHQPQAQRRLPVPRATQSELIALFNIIDINNKGFLVLEDFILIKNSMYTIQSAEYDFKRGDYNSDGKISLDEWLRFGEENPPSSLSIQYLIKYCLLQQYGFSVKSLDTMNRKKLFSFSRRHNLGLDACSTNEELRQTLKKLVDSKRPKQSWYEWLLTLWS